MAISHEEIMKRGRHGFCPDTIAAEITDTVAAAEAATAVVAQDLATTSAMVQTLKYEPVAAAAPAAVTLYVATTGSDTTGTGAQAHPFATPARALASIPFVTDADTTVIVAAGTYSDRVVVTKHLLSDRAKIEIRGEMVAQTLAGSMTVTADSVSADTVVCIANQNWVVDSLRGSWLYNPGTSTYYTIASNTNRILTLALAAAPGALVGPALEIKKPGTLLTGGVEVHLQEQGSLPSSSNTRPSFSMKWVQVSEATTLLNPLRIIDAYSNISVSEISNLDGASSKAAIACFGNACVRLADTYSTHANGFGTVASPSCFRFQVAGAVFSGAYYHINGGTSPAGARYIDITNSKFLGAAAWALGNVELGSYVGITTSKIKSCPVAINVNNGGGIYNIGTLTLDTVPKALSFNTAGSTTLRPNHNVVQASGLIASSGCSTAIEIASGCYNEIRLTGTTSISNCSAWGVKLASSVDCCGNSLFVASTVTMATNASGDFTLDGATAQGVDTAVTGLRAVAGKVIADLVSFNRASAT